MLDAALTTRLDPPQRGPAPADEWCEVPSGSRPNWCAVVTHAQAERRAAASLHRYGFESYLPLVTVRWANRTWHTSPLFRRYLFVRLDLTRPWHPVLAAPGVFQLVTFDGTKPATCSDAVIEALQAGEEARRTPITRETLYRPGTPCEAILGGGEPVDAVVISIRQDRAVVAAMMFGHLREIKVGLDSLRLRGA